MMMVMVTVIVVTLLTAMIPMLLQPIPKSMRIAMVYSPPMITTMKMTLYFPQSMMRTVMVTSLRLTVMMPMRMFTLCR